jgi:hypothetical protein
MCCCCCRPNCALSFIVLHRWMCCNRRTFIVTHGWQRHRLNDLFTRDIFEPDRTTFEEYWPIIGKFRHRLVSRHEQMQYTHMNMNMNTSSKSIESRTRHASKLDQDYARFRVLSKLNNSREDLELLWPMLASKCRVPIAIDWHVSFSKWTEWIAMAIEDNESIRAH